jgi:peptidoglycan/LPS O-acetylase OafA/YrhL
MKKNTFDRLNLLRIFAFLMIFLLHVKMFVPVTWYENVKFAWILFTPAWAGVWIFFILSGYGIGHGFYKNIYELSPKGILKYYYRRLIKIVPIYWAYLFIVTLFLKPDYLLPGTNTVSRLLSLFLFSYQEEFDSLYYGLAWYLSTLIRLYLIAPVIYFLIKRYLTGKKYFWPLFIALFFFGILFRISMGYHIFITGSGSWAPDIYMPFYFNLDLYFGGFILNELKSRQFKMKSLKVVPWLFFGGLVLYNSYIYYFANYFGVGNLNIYCYILPSAYLIVVCWLIFNYDILRNYSDTPLNVIELKKNKWRIIDYFAKLQMPLYLFHSTILLLMKNGYSESWYIKVVSMLHIPEKYHNFFIGCIFTAFSLVYSVIFAGFIHLCCEKTLFQFWDNCFRGSYSKLKRIINKVST